jgi:hypothetical protein
VMPRLEGDGLDRWIAHGLPVVEYFRRNLAGWRRRSMLCADSAVESQLHLAWLCLAGCLCLAREIRVFLRDVVAALMVYRCRAKKSEKTSVKRSCYRSPVQHVDIFFENMFSTLTSYALDSCDVKPAATLPSAYHVHTCCCALSRAQQVHLSMGHFCRKKVSDENGSIQVCVFHSEIIDLGSFQVQPSLRIEGTCPMQM